MNRGIFHGGLALVLGLTAACSDDDSAGEGSLAIHASGEEAAQGGYPVGSGDDEIAFTDGWTLEFRKVIVSLSDFALATSGGDEAELTSEPVVADLHRGEPDLWQFADVPAKRWDRVSYRYTPPSEDARKANDVSDADLERMRSEGYSFYIEATAHHEDREVELAWGFPFVVQMTRCQSADGTDGLVVRDNVSNTAQITVHLDHLFFDSWATEEPNLRFEAMAAVAPDDGPLTLDDLAEQDNLSDLQGPDGEPLDLAYDPGSAFNPVPKNLREYTIDAATTTGHWNGEGHCEYEKR